MLPLNCRRMAVWKGVDKSIDIFLFIYIFLYTEYLESYCYALTARLAWIIKIFGCPLRAQALHCDPLKMMGFFVLNDPSTPRHRLSAS